MTIKYILHIIFLGVIVTSAHASESRDTVIAGGEQPCIGEKTTYMIQPGDRLFSIGRQFGSGHFWEAIYIMNAEKITNPHYIYPGQVITIPYYIANFFEYGLPLRDVLNQPFCTTGEIAEMDWNAVDFEFLYLYEQNDMSTLSTMARAAVQQQRDRVDDGRSADNTDTLGQEVDDATLQAFREAFEELVRQEEEDRRHEQAQAESERSMFIEIDGMIHDDTRSKIGRDFYDIFYANWKSPPEASNYSIRITEQPAPNLGTVIAVEVNNTVTFRSRLQPRYDFIEEASQYAVRRTYMHLQHNQQQFQIY